MALARQNFAFFCKVRYQVSLTDPTSHHFFFAKLVTVSEPQILDALKVAGCNVSVHIYLHLYISEFFFLSKDSGQVNFLTYRVPIQSIPSQSLEKKSYGSFSTHCNGKFYHRWHYS